MTKINAKFTKEFYRIGNIAGMFYTVPGRETKRITIYGIGAPLPPDAGNLNDAATILAFDTDLFVVDYIGYGRSDGKFTPLNCIKTFLSIYKNLEKGCIAKCSYEDKTRKMKYREFHFIGRSFGASYVPLLPRFDKTVTNICSIFPVSNWKTVGTRQPEETVEGFYCAMAEDGYKYLYRGIMSSKWRDHFAGKDGFSLVENVKYLESAKLFLAHGKQDININPKHSVEYFKLITDLYGKNNKQFKFKQYPYDHSSKTSNTAVRDYFTFMNVPRRK